MRARVKHMGSLSNYHKSLSSKKKEKKKKKKKPDVCQRIEGKFQSDSLDVSLKNLNCKINITFVFQVMYIRISSNIQKYFQNFFDNDT